MADIDLSDINLDLNLMGGTEIGLGAIATVLGTGVNVAAGVTAGGSIDVGLGDIKARVDADADVDVGLDDIRIKELPVVRTDSKVDLGLDDIRITELPPFQFEFSMRPIRIHLPLSYSFCFELFGVKIFKFAVCGEGMVITEDYKAHATERCG